MIKIKIESAYFGAGCFWCTEAAFQQIKGVISVMPGYAGGTTDNPTYEKVSEGNTGHAEVAEVKFSPDEISYENLLKVFWIIHDPTSINRQGSDTGTQYRSIILTTSAEQKQQTEKSKNAVQAAYAKPVVTEIIPLDKFYPAENYHRNYYEKNKIYPYCQIVISPKLAHLRQELAGLMK